MVPDAAADGFGGLTLHQFFTLVAAFYAHIFVFDLVDFSVSEQQCFRTAGGWPGLVSGWAGLVLLLKTQGGFRALPLAAS